MEPPARHTALYHESLGTGRPLLVLHGLGVDHRYPRACLEPVFSGRDGWKRLYLDLPGHGKSRREDWILSNDQMVDAVVNFIDSVIPGQRFALAGLSYGGYLARGVAHHLSDRVDGILLWVPAHYPRKERHLPARVVLVKDDDVVAEASSEVEKEMLDLAVIQNRATLDLIREVIASGATATDEEFLARVSDSPFSFTPEESPVGKPALIVCGRQDFVVGYREAWDLLESYPRATFAVLDGAGHALGFTEQVATLRGLVGDWLERITA